jgi:hypothetical protein
MKRFIEGANRCQYTLLPEMLDDYVDQDNLVRVVDVFIDQLDLASLGFERVQPAATGRPAYHPSVLLKLYIYGYLNRILACHDAGISALVPPTKTSNAKADGRFDKADFVYDPQKNEYRCPAGQSLIWRFATVEKGMTNLDIGARIARRARLKKVHAESAAARDPLGTSGRA